MTIQGTVGHTEFPRLFLGKFRVDFQFSLGFLFIIVGIRLKRAYFGVGVSPQEESRRVCLVATLRNLPGQDQIWLQEEVKGLSG